MLLGDLVIHNKVAVFMTDVILRLSVLEKHGIYTKSPVSVRYLRVGETGKEKTVL